MNENGSSTAENVYAAPEAPVADVIPAGEQELAGRGARLAAATIDGIILLAILFPIMLVFGFNMFTSEGAIGFVTELVMTLGMIAIYIAVNGYFLHQNGQTVGKKLLGIRIVRSDGSKADLRRLIVLRVLPVWLAGLIPFVGQLVGLIDALLIFRASRKCLHDDIADTIVIKASSAA
jgi:uncharacterized RDD family membrane protein YckC